MTSPTMIGRAWANARAWQKPPPAPWLIRAGAWSGAILFIVCDAAIGVIFGHNLGSQVSPSVGYVFAAAALAGELTKPLAFKAVFDALKRLNFVKLAVFVPVAAVCIAYSFVSELSFSAMSRGDLMAERQASAGVAKSDQGRRARAETELEELKPSRPVGELEALIASAPQGCRIVVTSTSRRTVCHNPPTKLIAELGRAKRRAELEATVAAVSAASETVKEADPAAAALASVLGLAGLTVKTSLLSHLLYFALPLLLGIGSTCSLLVVDHYCGRRERKQLPAVASAPEPKPVAETVQAVTDRQKEAVRSALRKARRPLTNNELAHAMAVTKSESSKRVSAMNGEVHRVKLGRHVAISLHPERRLH